MTASATSPPAVLEVQDLSVAFGGLRAVDSVSFSLYEGECFGLIGPNGAGKSTIMNAINGLVPASGSVRLSSEEGESVDLLSQRPYQLRHKGIARTFQAPQLIAELTIEENILLGGYHTKGRMVNQASSDRAQEVLQVCGLTRWRHALAASAPHGVQKLADLARTLMAPSLLLLLDEPGAGLSRGEKELVLSVAKSDFAPKGVLVVDHDIDFVREMVHSIAVLDFGRLIISGVPDEVLAHPEVRTRYFGM